MHSQQSITTSQPDFFLSLTQTARQLVSNPEILISYIMDCGRYLNDNEEFHRPLETYTQNPRDIKYHQKRREYLFDLFINGELRDSKIAATSLLTNLEYQQWAKQAISEIASYQNIDSSTVFANIFSVLAIDPKTSEDIKMWQLALKENNDFLYVNGEKVIHNLIDAITLCGMITYGWILRDTFTGLIIDMLELYCQKPDINENASA